jgi:putative transposase
MARLARVVVPGLPHHVVQRGSHRQQTFFGAADYAAYLALMAESCARRGVAVWAWCLMPNHVHMIAVPDAPDALRRAIGEAHRRYARAVNAREDWRGHLWQERFSSFPMDQRHLVAAARYIAFNPVRAGLARRPDTWRWSSAAALLKGRPDPLAGDSPLPAMIGDFRAFLAAGVDEAQAEEIERHQRTGRPLGDDAFVESLEKQLKRPLKPRKRGRKPGRTHATARK